MTNLDALSKDDLIALIQEKDKAIKSQDRIINNLRKENTAKSNENQNLSKINKAIEQENKSLKLKNEGFHDVMINAKAYILDNKSAFDKLADFYPLDSYDFAAINNFIQDLIGSYISQTYRLNQYLDETYGGSKSEKSNPQRLEINIQNELSDEDDESEGSFDTSNNEKDEDDTSDSTKDSGGDDNNKIAALIPPVIAHNNEFSILKDSTDKSKDYANVRHCQRLNKGVVPKIDEDKIKTILPPVGPDIAIKSSGKIEYFCPTCNATRIFKIDPRVLRVNETISIRNERAHSSLCAVQNMTCSHCGCSVEVNPATLVAFNRYQEVLTHGNQSMPNLDNSSEKTIKKPNGDTERTPNMASTSHLSQDKSQEKNTEQTLSENKNATTKEQKAKIRELMSSKSVVKSVCDLKEHVINYKGVEVINPEAFTLNSFKDLPVFIKSKISVALCVVIASYFSSLTSPKNRITSMLQGYGIKLSRVQITNLINAFARAYLKPVTTRIHDDIITKCQSIIMDETTLKVRDNKTKTGNIKRSFIWCVNTSWAEDIKASWFTATPTRSHENVLDILRQKIGFKVRYLTTDAYSGYDCALEKIAKESGVKIAHSSCLTHARRPLHYYLKDSGLLDIYNKDLLPYGSNFNDFSKNLKSYNKKHKDKTLSQLDTQCLILYYLINSLFVVDASVIFDTKLKGDTKAFLKELAKARETASVPLVDGIYELIAVMLRDNKDLIITKYDKDGNITGYKRNKRYAVSGAIIYLLNVKNNMQVFLKEPRVELTSSAAERAIRLGACARSTFMFVNNQDSANAFCDYLTIINTCNLNNVSPSDYLLWLVANMKLRMHNKICKGYATSADFAMPKKIKYEDEVIDKDGSSKKVNITIDLYDPQNKFAYDRVDVTGLMPYDFAEILKAQDK